MLLISHRQSIHLNQKNRDVILQCSTLKKAVTSAFFYTADGIDHNYEVVIFLLKPLDCGYTLEAIPRVHTIYVSRKYMKKKLSTYVPSVLLYNVESKVYGQNFIRHFLALLFHVFKARSNNQKRIIWL